MVNLSCSGKKYNIENLLEIMRLLRSPQGCPWDREQSHASIRSNMIEEAYEAVDAIDRGSSADLCEELGDVLLQVVFHSQMSGEAGEFDFSDVTDGICRKLILRHPHIFGDTVANTSAEVLDNWDRIKRAEKHHSSYSETLEAVPRAFPALMRAQKVQKRAAKAGFDWQDATGPLEKIREETAELTESLNSGDKASAVEEYGDLLFSAVNLARHIGIDSENALGDATEKFIKRFAAVEKLAQSHGCNMKDVSDKQLDAWWEQVKKST